MLTAGHMLYVRPTEGRGLAHELVYATQTTIAPHLTNVELHVEWPDAKMSAALRCSIACCEWYCVDTKAATLVRLRGKERHNQLFALDPHNNATGMETRRTVAERLRNLSIIEQRFDPASPEGAEQVRELFDDMAPRHGIPEAIIAAVQASQRS